jgi:iron-sulfur cluster assembly accessory protein
MDLALPPTVTDRAFARLAEINDGSDSPQALRIAVEGGGCSGFQYDIKLEERPDGEVLVLDNLGLGVLVEKVSLQFLTNGVIDFTE